VELDFESKDLKLSLDDFDRAVKLMISALGFGFGQLVADMVLDYLLALGTMDCCSAVKFANLEDSRVFILCMENRRVLEGGAG